MKEVLLGLNLQLDFFPSGALNLNGNEAIIGLANTLAARFDQNYLICDAHPANHASFAANYLWRYPGQIQELPDGPMQLWLIHAVEGSFGSEIHPKIDTTLWDQHFYKGSDPAIEVFSAFSAKAKEAPYTLEAGLIDPKTHRLNIFGMCSEFDVLETALEARNKGYETTVFTDAIAPAGFTEEASEAALLRMEQAGVLLQPSTLVQ